MCKWYGVVSNRTYEYRATYIICRYLHLIYYFYTVFTALQIIEDDAKQKEKQTSILYIYKSSICIEALIDVVAYKRETLNEQWTMNATHSVCSCIPSIQTVDRGKQVQETRQYHAKWSFATLIYSIQYKMQIILHETRCSKGLFAFRFHKH